MKSNRVYRVLALALVAVAVCLGRVTADESPAAPAYPTAVCSLGKVFQQYARTQDMMARIKDMTARLEQQKKEREGRITQGHADLQELQPGSQAEADLRASLEKKVIETRIWMEVEEARIDRLRRTLTASMYGEMAAVIKQIADERGIQIVVNSVPINLTGANPGEQLMLPYVLHHSDAVDISAEVVRRLNEKYKSQNSAP